MYPLDNSSFDVIESKETLLQNNSVLIHFKNPLQLFDLDSTYTYVGIVSDVLYDMLLRQQ